MDYGYVKVYRKLLDNPISSNLELLGLLTALLLKANHKGNSFFVGYKKIAVKPGQFISSQEKLASEFGMNRNKMIRLLNYLKDEEIVNIKGYTKYSLFTIKNRLQYQNVEQQNEQPVNNKGTISEQQVNTNKNDKNDKNDKNTFSSSIEEEKQKEKKPIKKTEEPQEVDFLGVVQEKIENFPPPPPPKKSRKPVDTVISSIKYKCLSLGIVYDPTDERNFASHILSKKFSDQCHVYGFFQPMDFVNAVIDMSMEEGSWRKYRANGPRAIYQQYPKIIAEFQNLKEKEKKTKSRDY